MSLKGYPAIRHSGFSLFELIVFIILLAILMGFFFDRMLFYQEVVEEASMRQTVNMINTSMNLKLADWIAKGENRNIPQLGTRNPMDWLEKNPANYVGELYDPEAGEVQKGSWYCDLRDGNLVYLVKHDAHFRGGERKWIRFRVDLNDDAKNHGGFIGARLVPASAYSWFSH